MNTKCLNRTLCFGMAGALALTFAGTAAAQQNPNTVEATARSQEVDPVALLARATGLTEYQVELELGNRTAWANNAVTYDITDDNFRRLVGYGVYQDLKTRDELTARDVRHLTAIATQRHEAEQVAGVK